MTNHNYFIRMAFELAQNVQAVRGARIVALVVYRNKVIGVGHNHLKSHPFQRKFAKNSKSIFFHAETSAIKDALDNMDDLSKCTLYVARAKLGGKTWPTWQYGLAKPCCGCQKCIDRYNIKEVFYTQNEKGITHVKYG